ncbi:uncharacterized protein LOC117581982 isoform X2 [Drosophila guanche]|uniref:uncharacterized protein LOC117581982 isoform X2 n=1 Tax=Drosophila guanche TaxID=7266 RepID=UPI001472027C|nr:uncharacterized protein LOC117581982 isoform X2 [Drosophila guanche]
MVFLQKVGSQDLEHLLKLYSCDQPKYCTELQCLDNFFGLYTTRSHLKHVEAYTLPHQELGLFVIVDRYQLFVGSLNNTNGLLQQALELLDWSAGFKCSSIPSRHIQAVDNVVQSKQLELEFRDPTNLFYMKAEDALKLKVEPSAGFILKSLSVTDAPLINEEWPNHHLGSLYFIQRQIRMCVNAGLYAEDSKELVAWCIRLQGGYLGALQVKSGHERRGFGTLVTREISHRLGTQGHDVMALVGPSNKPSAGMFSKLGFRIIDQCYWLRTMPTNGELTWSEGE